jgi:PTS system N-acetylglucosamine-specific IIC component
MAEDHDGTAALSGIVSLMMVQTMLSPATMALLYGIDEALVNPAFSHIDNGNQFIGILCGFIGAACYNRFKNVRLPSALSFFSGKRCVAIITAGLSLFVVLFLALLWPFIYDALTVFGEGFLGLGALGAGLYAFFNRLLIPFGLHHALNAVFWFDMAGIDDIAKFWGTNLGGVYGQTGMYMTGFFPVMMFGLPGAALAMYRTAKPGKKRNVTALLLSAAYASFFAGITEPLEFSFMFLAPALYLVHAGLTAVSVAVCALLPVRAGFYVSAGFTDLILSSKAPMALNSWLILPIGAVLFMVYYFLFKFIIVKFDLKTPGRDDDSEYENERNIAVAIDDYPQMAKRLLAALGGAENIVSVDNCISRLRIEVRRHEEVSERKIKAAGAAGIIRPSKTSVQIVIGTYVQFVTDELKKML